MAFTKIVGAGIHTLSNVNTHNINSSGIITATKFVGPFDGSSGDFSGNVTIDGNLTVNGDTTTLNTTLREVELLRVDAQNDNVTAGIITQRGTGNILDLYDTSSAVFSVRDGGNIIMGASAGSITPHAPLHIRTATTGAITSLLKLHGPFTSNTGSEGTAIDFGTAADTSTGARIIGSREAAGAKGALRFCTGRENDAGFNDGHMVIDETGKVGIGSAIPQAQLDVTAGAVVVNSFLKTTSSKSYIEFQHNAGTTYNTRFGSATLGAGNVGLLFETGLASARIDAMVIDRYGKVGINTTTPDTPLHIYANDPQQITVERSTNMNSSIRYKNTVGSMYAGLAKYGYGWAINGGDDLGDDPMFLVERGTGDVGIGTTNPRARLHIFNINPVLRLTDSNQAADNRDWNISAGHTQGLRIQAINNAGSGGGTFFQFNRVDNNVNEFIGTKGGNTWFVVDNDNRKVGVGTTNPNSQLSIFSDADGEELLHFDMGSVADRRGWKFKQGNTGTSTELVLQADENGKSFQIKNSSGDEQFYVYTASSGAYVRINQDLHILDTIQHIGDSDTKIRFPEENTISMETAGSERARITGIGSFGIGTNNPRVALEVKQQDADVSVLRLRDSSAQYRYLDFDVTGATSTITARSNNSHGNINIGTLSQFGRNTAIYVKGTSGPLVGIGTDNPLAKLEVYRDDAGLGNIVNIEQDGTGDAVLGFAIKGIAAWQFGIDNSDSDKFKISYDGSGLASSTSVTLDRTGKVGIGTNNPTALLTLAKDANPTLTFLDYTNNAQSSILGSAGGQLVFQTDINNVNANSDFIFRADSVSNEIVRFKDSGEVGIGTNNPVEKLDVQGHLALGEVFAINRARIILSAPDGSSNYRHLFGANLKVDSSGTFTTPSENISGGGWLYRAANSLNAHGHMTYMSAPDTNGASSTPLERLRIDAAGRVLIGDDTTPNAVASVAVVGSYGASSNLTPFVYLCRDETVGNVTNNESLGQILFASKDGYRGAVIEGRAAGSWSSSTSHANLIFKTTAATSTVPSEIVRITSDAKIGIATHTPTAKVAIGRVTGGYMNMDGVQVNRTHSLGLTNGVFVYTDVGYNPTASYRTAAFKAVGVSGAALGISTDQGSNGKGGTLNARLDFSGGGYFLGNIGIGTDNPGNKLDVIGGNIRVGKTSNGQFIGENNSGVTKIKLDTDGVSYINGGKLGIGTDVNITHQLTLMSPDTVGSTENDRAYTSRFTTRNPTSQLNLDIYDRRWEDGQSHQWIGTEKRIEYNVNSDSNKRMWMSFFNPSNTTTDNAIRFGEQEDTEWMRIHNGMVGIGTNNTNSSPLYVRGVDAAALVLERTLTNNCAIRFRNNTSSMYAGLAGNALGFAIDDDENLGDGPMMIVRRDTGRLGINVGTTPSYKLHVKEASVNTVAAFESGDAGAGILLKDNTHHTRIETTDGAFKIDVDVDNQITAANRSLSFQINASTKLSILNSGVVQLNTANNAHIRGGVYAKYTGASGNTANINTSSIGKVSWLQTNTEIFENGGFTNNATDVTVPYDGIYMVMFNGYLEGASAARTNVRFRFQVNGTDETADLSLNNYIRHDSAHDESSVNLTAYLNLSANDTVAVSAQQIAAAGDVVLVKNLSSLTFHLVA